CVITTVDGYFDYW
nr:immunoglobulin heavy chain junction region [Mus musculus]MBK4195015.1 immunoglobulin heavy chain junction region [Mus musculus]